jgi:hypothetical protein
MALAKEGTLLLIDVEACLVFAFLTVTTDGTTTHRKALLFPLKPLKTRRKQVDVLRVNMNWHLLCDTLQRNDHSVNTKQPRSHKKVLLYERCKDE